MIWFTSDTHFNHETIIRYSNRPFSSLEEMTETMIIRWNQRIRRGDMVYHLGDFALTWGKKHLEPVQAIFNRLNGQKHLIEGNHDRREVVKGLPWEWVKPYHELKVDLGGVHKQRIVLCHYALRVWNQMHRGAWMLHGHSHGNLVDTGGRILDTGVDVHEFAPISIDEVAEWMKTRFQTAVDHHVEE